MTKPEETNPFQVAIKSEGAALPVEQHRAVQEVQAAMIIAKKFPRDQHAAYGRIMQACERSSLADAASYSYPKGGTMITGPSIRLAEVMAQNWGNMEFGIRELSQDANGSEVQAFAWDLETNVKQSKTFVVPHKMKAKGKFKTLSDPRDIYEHVANMGARRLRACILGVIPGDIVDAAVVKCEETLTKGDGKPIEDRVRDMLARFKEIEISQELIEQRLQHKTTAIVRSQLVELGKIYNSIKDGMSKSSDWFDVPKSQQSAEPSTASDLTAAIQKKTAEQKPVEEKEEKATTAISCPYCKENIRTVIINMLEGGRETFTCSACEREGKIEAGQPVGIYPVDQTASNSEGSETEDQNPDTWGEWRTLWINKQGPGFTTFFHKNRADFERAPDKLKAEAKAKWEKLYDVPWPLDKKFSADEILDEISKFSENIRLQAEKELDLGDLGREWSLSEMQAVIDKCKELDGLSPEGAELAAVMAEIQKYPPSRESEALNNLQLPTNRPLSLDESNLLLAECVRLTQPTTEDLA